MNEDNLIGTILRNRYSIIDSLGNGAFGKTDLANDLDLPGQPACVVKHLKPIDPKIVVATYAKERFEKEAQTLYRLGNEHNQIPQLFAHFQEHQEFYLVQEFVEGHDLTKEISPSSSKPEKFVFKLLNDILTVLAFVHQQNVIHRDIKPQNLMRRKTDGKIVLIDFGAVKKISK
ncbi:serine/threonine protein kinase [Calothrix sp. NIES-2100]|uniref:protein kinase domain-containing protein n=1 Tax=Calothrix sp. NIES-2100 TaxID=1954172 RepID=UPI000B5F6719|nr:serine/threonine protein kinase [Calothrix sp. NIES-2100]